MIFDLKDLVIFTIPIAFKVYKIYSNLVGRPLRDNWFDRRFFNCLRREVTNRAPRNNPLNILKSNIIIPFKDPFMCLLNPYFLSQFVRPLNHNG
jgi:hypothetical protein